MTWSRVATLSQSEVSDRWKAFFDTHLSTITGWTVNSVDSGSSRQLIYTYTDADDGSTQSDYFYWTGSTYCYDQPRYITTPGDNFSITNASRINVDNEYISDWTIWTTDENPGSIAMMENTAINFFWQGPAERRNPTKWPWLAGEHDQSPTMFPIMERSTHHQVANFYKDYDGNYVTNVYPDCSHRVAMQYGQSPVTEFYQEYSLGPTDAAAAPWIRFNDNDVVMRVPSYPQGGFYGINYIGSGALIFDGTNYWYSSSNSVVGTTMLLNMGTTEPVFS